MPLVLTDPWTSILISRFPFFIDSFMYHNSLLCHRFEQFFIQCHVLKLSHSTLVLTDPLTFTLSFSFSHYWLTIYITAIQPLSFTRSRNIFYGMLHIDSISFASRPHSSQHIHRLIIYISQQVILSASLIHVFSLIKYFTSYTIIVSKAFHSIAASHHIFRHKVSIVRSLHPLILTASQFHRLFSTALQHLISVSDTYHIKYAHSIS